MADHHLSRSVQHNSCAIYFSCTLLVSTVVVESNSWCDLSTSLGINAVVMQHSSSGLILFAICHSRCGVVFAASFVAGKWVARR